MGGHDHRATSVPLLRSFLALGLLGWAIPGSLLAEALEVGVRTKIMKPYAADFIEPEEEHMEHGKIYSVKAVKRVPSEWNLVKAVDERKLRHLTELFLNANGFRESGYTERAEIVITVAYGRGYVRNPYLLDTGRVASGVYGGSGAMIVGGNPNEHADEPSVTITGGSRQLMSEKNTAYRAQVAKAEQEKLFIQLTAWDNPLPATGAPSKLWVTTMVVDDPDHRDLNEIGGKMLQAGAPYFGRNSKELEIVSNQALPEGRVTVGEPHRVDPVEPKAK